MRVGFILAALATALAVGAAFADDLPRYALGLALAIAGVLGWLALRCWDPLGEFDPAHDDPDRTDA